MKGQNSISLYMAAVRNDVIEAKKLCDKIIDIDKRHGHSKWSPLHAAAFYGNLEMVNFLIEKGADKDVVDVRRKTPLSYAQDHGYSEIVRCLNSKDKNLTKEKKNYEHETKRLNELSAYSLH